MIKTLLTTLFIASLSLAAMAQGNDKLRAKSAPAAAPSKNNTAKQAEDIKANSDYICGEGHGSTYDEAKANAINSIVADVSAIIVGEAATVQNGTNENGVQVSKDAMEQKIAAYTRSTMKNIKEMTVCNKPDFHVLCYIERNGLEKIFNDRLAKATGLIKEAMFAQNDMKIDIALRNYYWAYALVRSLQYPYQAVYTTKEGESKQMMTWIPERIEEILGKIKPSVVQADKIETGEMMAQLFFTMDGKPVKSLDFRFFNGTGYSSLNKVNNSGVATINVDKNADAGKLKICYEYTYSGLAQRDPEVECVLAASAKASFAGSEAALADESKKSIKDIISKQASMELAKANTENSDIGIEELTDSKTYSKTMAMMKSCIEKRDISPIESHCTPEGWNMVKALLQYGKARILGKQQLKYYNLSDGRVACRSMRMNFNFPNNHKTFTEDVVFTFNKEGLIEAIAFGLGSEAKKNVFDKGKKAGWDKNAMMVIVEFLENYQTAFALKRLEYIESIFADNAVIITGHIVKRKTAADNPNVIHFKDNVKYNRQTKEQYMNNLRKCFKSNEYINICFADNNVTRMDANRWGEAYGIQIHQDYFSSSYSDTGYLFLLVDFNEPSKPTIQVRAWQPERDPDFTQKMSSFDRAFGLIGGYNFQ